MSSGAFKFGNFEDKGGEGKQADAPAANNGAAPAAKELENLRSTTASAPPTADGAQKAAAFIPTKITVVKNPAPTAAAAAAAAAAANNTKPGTFVAVSSRYRHLPVYVACVTTCM